MTRDIIHTEDAPAAIGTYSQAVKVGPGAMIFVSGQIPLNPQTMEVVGEDFSAQATQVFRNLEAVVQASGGQLGDCVKLTIYLTDLGQFSLVNTIMSEFFSEPYPARAAVEVSALPKGVQVEVDAIVMLPAT